ncbi:sodium/potassium/calcium exchanger 1-like [Salarias fasciatus]|uniref:sodium/potassium/calcium exchanger 1-like n=1 Tax=Salarias fasciatus TaxID=181472 RepID=UPI0011765082|nr:sodium/potassium/calcium exchanger 1-like [Salarias fasciatus]
MRPSSRRRAAAWLLALPLGRGGEECARRGRLEMISFWLLCWKLLRATAGLRRNTPELTDGNPDDDDASDNPPTQPADPVTMEISSSPPLTDLERDGFFSYQIQDQPDGPAAGKEAAGGEYDKGDECDYLVFEIGEEKGAARGAGSEGGDEGRGETEGQDEGRGEIDGEEEGRGETEGEDEGRRDMEIKDEDRGRVEGEDGKQGETKTEDLGKREIEGEDGGQGGSSEEWMEGAGREERGDSALDLLLDGDPLLARPSPGVTTCSARTT